MLRSSSSSNCCFKFANHALPVNQVADEEQREPAKTKIGHAQSPLVALRVLEDQWIHEDRQAGGQHEHKDR